MDIVKCYCSTCKNVTNHERLFVKDVTGYYEDVGIETSTKYSVVQCLGCEAVQFHKEYQDSDMLYFIDENTVEPYSDVKVYPNHKEKIAPIDMVIFLPPSIQVLYEESNYCLNNGQLLLAAVGYRAVVEAICKDAGVTGKALETKINNLAKAHIITAKDRDHLHAIRFMGNDAVHEFVRFPEQEIVIVARIVNTILTSLYVIEKEVKSLRAKPVKTYKEFEQILDSALCNHPQNSIVTLQNLIRDERRIIKEDLPNFEVELQQNIISGVYTKLRMCPAPASGCKQQYQVL